MTPERESLIDELRRELGRVRAALVESMDWGWSVYIPPDEVVARYEAALGLTDTIADFADFVQQAMGIDTSIESCISRCRGAGSVCDPCAAKASSRRVKRPYVVSSDLTKTQLRCRRSLRSYR